MPKRTLYLAAYDVTDPDRLERALYIMKNYASGGQKSVFECYLSDRERDRLVMDIEAVLDWRTDRFLLLPLGDIKVRTLGIALPPSDPDFYYFG
ncbi:MAG: CRISPR-associated endonuclease Cas2 [Candidatus Contendobacter sp.]|nr:CRISPR-associated endonuclease Cas2 [Candidatus Contendobacter sp.]